MGSRAPVGVEAKPQHPLKAVGFWTSQGHFRGSPGRYFLQLKDQINSFKKYRINRGYRVVRKKMVCSSVFESKRLN